LKSVVCLRGRRSPRSTIPIVESSLNAPKNVGIHEFGIQLLPKKKPGNHTGAFKPFCALSFDTPSPSVQESFFILISKIIVYFLVFQLLCFLFTRRVPPDHVHSHVLKLSLISRNTPNDVGVLHFDIQLL
jgi:hypothetical protein